MSNIGTEIFDNHAMGLELAVLWNTGIKYQFLADKAEGNRGSSRGIVKMEGRRRPNGIIEVEGKEERAKRYHEDEDKEKLKAKCDDELEEMVRRTCTGEYTSQLDNFTRITTRAEVHSYGKAWERHSFRDVKHTSAVKANHITSCVYPNNLQRSFKGQRVLTK